MTPQRTRLTFLSGWLATAGALLSVSIAIVHEHGFLSGLVVGMLVAVVLGLSLATGTEFRRLRDERSTARLDDIDPLGGISGGDEGDR